MEDINVIRVCVFLCLSWCVSGSSTPKVPNDLLDLQPAFQPSLPLSTGLPLANTWGGERVKPQDLTDLH